MNIRDRDVRLAIDTLTDEFENAESVIEDLKKDKLDLEKNVGDLEDEVASLEARIKELEEALAEAYLTSEIADEFSRDTVVLPPGCGPNVSDPAGN